MYHTATITITPATARKIRAHCKGSISYIRRGRSCNSAGVTSTTKIVIVPESDRAPKLEGQPYLKTNFCGKGGFRKTLYTPSTLRIEVGAKWQGFQA